MWRDPAEHPGLAGDDGPLHLLSCQPATRLHSQYDHGAVSRESKIAGREPIRIHPGDAAARGIGNGDVVRVFNRRGAFLAGAVLTEGIRPGVLQIATGAWYDPVDPDTDGSLDAHGNPNMVTPDTGTSDLAQGCSAQSALVEVERFTGPLPPIRAFQPPRFVDRP
ncbi:molybdopterin dinucleotide binding domain-containing protein [Azospirillum sp. 11R-A]|uniref:molybdopterin dinucleotide binding domain-containing protein n=1 Tax=Azospirillum sp. 11R-A TaxID=3111634 RepID=UPI003C1462D7